jgi:membrane protein YdbS with pleckstrin-like domain
VSTIAALKPELERLEHRIRRLKFEKASSTHELEASSKEADRLRRHLRAAKRGEEAEEGVA